jgi:phasin family protein
MGNDPQKAAASAMSSAASAGKAGVNAAADFARSSAESGSRATSATMDAGLSAMSEMTRMFADFRLPGAPDMQALMAAHRRNLDTLAAANRVAMEGAQAIARRNMEIMQQSMAEMTETIQAMATPDNPQTKAARQAELVKRSYERAVANLREISDLIQKSNGEAVELLNRRFTEALDEVRALIHKPG